MSKPPEDVLHDAMTALGLERVTEGDEEAIGLVYELVRECDTLADVIHMFMAFALAKMRENPHTTTEQLGFLTQMLRDEKPADGRVLQS